MGILARATMKWKSDQADFRDNKFSDTFKIDKTNWKPLTENIKKCPPVYNQFNLGSCSSNSLAGHLQYLHPVMFGTHCPSRLFIYWNERFIENTIDDDSGAELRDGIKSLVRWGACSEDLWPYDVNNFKTKPSDACFEAAKVDIISAYYRIDNIDELKQCMNDGFIASFGFICYDNFDSDIVANTGYLPLPKQGENVAGGHAVVAIDYGIASDYLTEEELSLCNVQPSQDVFLIKNSWGNEWGLKKYPGYFLMPVEYISNPNLATDFWTIRK